MGGIVYCSVIYKQSSRAHFSPINQGTHQVTPFYLFLESVGVRIQIIMIFLHRLLAL